MYSNFYFSLCFQISMEFKPPEELISPAHWRLCKQQFTLYLEASEKTSKPNKTKIALLLHCIGKQYLDAFNSFSTSEDVTYEDVISKFDDHFNPTQNVIYERHLFFPVINKKQISFF